MTIREETGHTPFAHKSWEMGAHVYRKYIRSDGRKTQTPFSFNDLNENGYFTLPPKKPTYEELVGYMLEVSNG